MVECKKVILAGIPAGLVMLAVSFGLMPVWDMIFPGLSAEYVDSGIFRPWSDPWMSYIFIQPFITGLILAFVFNGLHPFKKMKWLKRGLFYGFVFWSLVTIPGMLVTYSSFLVSANMVISWTLNGLIGLLLAGLIVVRFAE